eukprot:TRINITY_DN54633_c0_g1_i1.p1 TRINITY_DN54633_c0_g1~~TRINITY_DN54633_c0_g1_i1.p1  ORF type:complete len:432 (+),score=99.75 TRINITY_DN54633_c0_g1_i1:88-1383(+)
MSSSSPPSEIDEEELRLDLDDKINEVTELQQELREKQLGIQQMKLRLKAVEATAARTPAGRRADGSSGPSQGPQRPIALPTAQHSAPQAPASPLPAEDPRASEMRSLFQWIAEHIDLVHGEKLYVNQDVSVQGHTATLRTMVQWPLLCNSAEQLYFSVPIEHERPLMEVLDILKQKRPITIDFMLLANHWAILPGAIAVDLHAQALPAVLLAYRGSNDAAVVGSWPTAGALEGFRAYHATDGDKLPTVGDRVSVEYEGVWYPGVLQSMDSTGRASVNCDADPTGTLTIAPAHRLRKMTPAGTVVIGGHTVHMVPEAGGGPVQAALSQHAVPSSVASSARAVPPPQARSTSDGNDALQAPLGSSSSSAAGYPGAAALRSRLGSAPAGTAAAVKAAAPQAPEHGITERPAPGKPEVEVPHVTIARHRRTKSAM